MPNIKSELEKKFVLIDKAMRLLDLLYSEADAKADTAIQQFRGKVLQQLDQLRNANYEDEIKILTEFNNQLISILIEAGSQIIQLKDNVGNETFNILNVNSNNLAHEKAEFNFGETNINLGPTYRIDFYHNENKTEQPTLNDQKESLVLLYKRFSSFYAGRRVKRTFGESEEGEVFDDLYTRLALIRKREVEEDREYCRKDLISLQQMSADRMARDEHLHLFEHILYTERKPIEEDQLFSPIADDAAVLRQKGRIDRILIRGQAGVGKTTFCYYLARKLIEQNHWVFVIPLRHLRSAKQVLTDVDVVEKALGKLTEPEHTLLTQLLIDKTQSIYWLLDGVDEVVALSEDHPLQEWLIEAFRKERVMVTTRPRAMKDFDAQRQVEMIGYLPEDVERYINRYFSKQPEKIRTFTTFIKQQKQLGAIHRIPIILELMCWVWNGLISKQNSGAIQLSLTDLYVKVLYGLNRSYLLKIPTLKSLVNDGMDEEIEEALWKSCLGPLMELAYQTFTRDQLIFTGGEVATYLPHLSIDDRSKLLYEFGLVRRLSDMGSFNLSEFSFIHLTIQEFLMAKWWVQLFTSKELKEVNRAIHLLTGRKANGEWIDCHKYDKRFEVVWGFVAGLLRDQPIHMQRFLDLIAGAPRDQIGARHISLLLQVVGEANCLNENIREYGEIVAWLSNNDYRHTGLEDYASVLARYPTVVSVLQKACDKLWANKKEGNRDFVIGLLSWVPLDEKGKIYSDLVRELETDTEISRRLYSAARALGEILLTETQQEQVIRLLCNSLQDADERNGNASDIIYALKKIYSRRPFLQGYPSNLFEPLFACIKKWSDIGIINVARVLGAMDLPEEERSFIIDTLLDRWLQAQCESFGPNIKQSLILALGLIPIPEKQQEKITQFLLDIANNKSNDENQGAALTALSLMDPPKALLSEVINTFLKYWDSSDWRNLTSAAENGLRRMVILLREPEQEKVMETLLTHLRSHNRNEKKWASLSVLESMKIAKNYQALFLDTLWNGLHDRDDKVKRDAVRVLQGMDKLEVTQPRFIEVLLDGLKTSSLTEAMVKALDIIPISEELKPKVRDALLNKFSQEDNDYVAGLIVTSLGRIGISPKLSKKIMEISYVRRNYAFCDLNSYCLILDNDLPCYLREVPHTFVFDSVDAKTVLVAGTFNKWLNANKGKIVFWQHHHWEMEQRNGRIWELTIRLLPGSYEFKYVIDGGRRWETDPNYPLSVNGNSELKIERTIRRMNETHGNNELSLTAAHSADSHAQILSRLRSNSNNASTMTVSSLPSKQAVDNEVALTDAEVSKTDSTKASEEEDDTTDMTHTMGW